MDRTAPPVACHFPRRIFFFALVAGLLPGAWSRLSAAGDPAPTPEQLNFFEKRVRPVLAEHCYKCHGPEKQKANLRVDSRAGLLQGGDSGPAIVPRRPDEGFFAGAVSYGDVFQMPPTGKLPAEHIESLRQWVEMGAPWPDEAPASAVNAPADEAAFAERALHWSFLPLAFSAAPAVRDANWPSSPLDAFILARLEAAGLAPTPPADKAAWLRRVTFDLTGLPPSPGEIEQFLAEEGPAAYERIVERLLNSPRYGERWARHWLDLVRYAETAGHEFDFDMHEAYRYRDYVVRAFNDDLPYDRFVIEHVAGDLAPQPRKHPTEGWNESILATGFWHLGESKHSPVDIREDAAARSDNQIDVFAKAFLGLGVSCARCHDHKFDPITTQDYYALCGYLRSSRFQQAFIDPPEPRLAALAEVQTLRQQAHGAVVRAAVAERDRYLGLGAQGEAATAWPRAVDAQATQLPTNVFRPWVELRKSPELTGAAFADARGALARDMALQAEPSPNHVVFDDFNRPDYAGWFVTGEAFDRPTVGGEPFWQADDARPIRQVLPPGVAHSGRRSTGLHGVLRSPSFTIEHDLLWYRLAGQGCQVRLVIDNFQQIRAPIYGDLAFEVGHGDRFVWHGQNVSMWKGHRAFIEFLDHGPGFVAIDAILAGDGTQPRERVNGLALSLAANSQIDDAAGLAEAYRREFADVLTRWRDGDLGDGPAMYDRAELLNWLLLAEPPCKLSPGVDGFDEASVQRLALAAEREKNLPISRRAMAMADGTGEDENVFIRGSHKTQGEKSPRRFLQVLGGQAPVDQAGSGRLELARAMVDPSRNPLVPRVIVNRIWKHHFGVGLAPTPDDLGHMGARPTHPELLDYLASQFVREGWSLKGLHRSIVLSSTYRQGSHAATDADQADPRNELYHRANVRRLEAESIRDAILAVSGRLDASMYGPSVPPHLTPFMVGRGRPGSSGPLDGAGRRSIYLGVRRNFIAPMLLAFDYPVPFTTIGRRGVSNVPAQALVLLNNPFVIEQAQRWSQRVLAEPGLAPADRVAKMYQEAFGRAPEPREVEAAAAFLAKQHERYGDNDEARPWADLCHVLFNVKEFVFLR